jgi:hypothetical protein
MTAMAIADMKVCAQQTSPVTCAFLGLGPSVSDGREGPFDQVDGPDVLAMLGREGMKTPAFRAATARLG